METLLQRQADDVSARDRVGYLADWAPNPTSGAIARRTYANLTHLGVPRITPRLSLASPRQRGSGWTGRVDLTWRLPGRGATPASSTVRYRFVSSGGQLAIAGISRAAGAREPIWLLPALAVRTGPRTVVAAAGSAPDADRLDLLLRRAVRAVDQVLPHWRGTLVAYLPGSSSQFASLLGATRPRYRAVAAVTTTVDGSADVASPVAIVVNPRVFDGLGPIGAQVVVTHEATHAATGAAAVSMPLWVAEGFADYVAIGAAHLSVAVAARAALAAVRREGAPPTLPGDDAFALGGDGLERTYEEAWLAVSLLARVYGQARVVAFYQAVERHPRDLDDVLARVLSTSVAEFTTSWRSYLQAVADGG